jgi:hypothetical protein
MKQIHMSDKLKILPVPPMGEHISYSECFLMLIVFIKPLYDFTYYLLHNPDAYDTVRAE